MSDVIFNAFTPKTATFIHFSRQMAPSVGCNSGVVYFAMKEKTNYIIYWLKLGHRKLITD
ncbi:hypothetical protein AB205_0215240 [Aquarana catesbeiana]|uniref:Uncharacterized protein n=1 Tax=Aquarana catesbeiana TaxID=8400 RepID=A0A2G9S7M1_AQUCT|nr:hypothetical protein AB205_0215240 [Aquarana catesbeiana]